MLLEKFDFSKIEEGRYDAWQKSGLFYADHKSAKKPFTLVIPPPNVTGKLHIGHAIDNVIQDVAIRIKRMQGFDTLYLPGTDHAGIATQAKVDALLKKEKTNRFLIGREKFLERAYEWTILYQGEIEKQWAKMGLSLDLTKKRFTLDKKFDDAVFYVFKKLYDKGYIYRDYRIINFDTEALTALSNVEVIYKEEINKLFYIKYKIVGENNFLTIATTRPETLFADTAIMVNPNDKRYLNLKDKEVIIPSTDKKIPIIFDSYVDQNFGSGIVKVTPAHDQNDYLVGKRHNLQMPLCMNENGTMNELAGEFKGLDRFLCREKLIEKLKKLGQLEKISDHKNSVGYSERTDTVVEPRLSLQWFVKMSELKKLALKNKVKIYPTNLKKNFQRWLNETEDWCISRQLWWGHRIPVWYGKNNEIIVSKTSPGKEYKQDEDVLDTWFSSALWPFVTLGFPDTKNPLYKKYYPTSLLVTGYDIMFFWVSRMVFQGLEFTGKDPFKECLFHGLVRDNQGRKVSKSLNNGIDPRDVINQYGADSLRYFLISNSTPGLDFRYDEQKVRSSWNLINKIYNIARFISINIPDIKKLKLDYKLEYEVDYYIINKMNALIKEVNFLFNQYLFHEGFKKIANFIWDEFASIYLESSKYYLQIEKTKLNTSKILKYVLIQILKLLHPAIPFVSDYLYENLSSDENITTSAWPKIKATKYIDNFKVLNEVIKIVRNTKNEGNLSFKDKISLNLLIKEKKQLDLILNNKDFLINFLNLSELTINKLTSFSNYTLKTFEGINLYFKTSEIISNNETNNLDNIKKRIQFLENEIKRSTNILSNENFLKKANPEKVMLEKQKFEAYKKELKELKNE